MTQQAAQFIGDIPTNYDAGLGPHLFVDYAADLARRAAAGKPARVLEIAAGTGIVTRLLRDALPCSTHLVASDLNPPMLEIGYHRIDAIKTSLVAAGFEDTRVHVLKIDKTIPKARRFAEGLLFGNPIVGEVCAGDADPDAIVLALTAALQRAFGEDPGRMSLQAIVFSALKR